MATIILTGSCGDNATFNLYDDGLLEILGTGKMTSYANYTDYPWWEYRYSISRITFAEGITEISGWAFCYCDVKSISFSSTITIIKDSAFASCKKLTKVDIPDSVTEIDSGAFNNCSSLEQVTIGAGLTEIYSCFLNCAKLKKVTLKGQPPTLSSTTVFDNTPIKDGTGRINVPRQYLDNYTSDTNWGVFKAAIHGVESLAELFKKIAKSIRGVSGKTDTIVAQYFPDEITNTADGIKTACNEVIVEKGGTEVANLSELPKTIKKIPASKDTIKLVFNGANTTVAGDYSANTEIEEIEMINTTEITGNINAPNLKRLTYADSYVSDNLSIDSADNLEEIALGGTTSDCVEWSNLNKLKKIKLGINENFNTLYLPNSDYTADDYPDLVAYDVSEDNESLSSVNGLLLNKDGTELYQVPTGLTSITIPDGVTSIDGSAFDGCTGLTSVTIPDSVTSIGDYAFSGCTGLTSITIPDSVTSIGSYAFRDCTGLTSITIPDSVTSIGQYAFSGCTGLTSVTIGNGVTSIGNYAFQNCTGLTSITIGNSVTSIGRSAFQNCSNLKTVYYTGTLKQWCESVAFTPGNSNPNYYADTLYINGEKIEGKVVIPDGTTKIKNYAFKNITAITEVVIPDSVTSIGSYAFRDCTGLTSATLGTGVSVINSYTFNGCTSLINLTLNKADTYVTLSNTSALTNTPIVTSTTEGYAYVPSTLLEQYKAATNWATYANKIKAIGSE